MNRKTNIFYNASSEDSKFLTFNNYTEALTGDILAIDYKLWPSRFICVYIEDLDKEDFILKLQQYYENKLTVLRDSLDNHSTLKPLNYLIVFLYWYAYNKQNNWNQIVSPLNIEIGLYNNDINILNSVQFNYISDIVEQQYNGTYSDIICTINPNKWYKPILNFASINTVEDQPDIDSYYIENNSVFKLKDTDIEYLYGWYNENSNTKTKLGDWIKDPIVDTISQNDEQLENIYYVKSLIENLTITEVDTFENHNLKFNIVIPLFNLINTNNSNDISNDIQNSNSIELNNKVNIPLGIYFTDSTMNLNINGKFSTNWSLLISTQFSAFPFSYDIQQNFDDSQSTKQAYLTFAEILANQTNFTDALTKYDNLIKSLQQRIILLESKLNNISSVQNIDGITQNITIIQNNQSSFMDDVNKKLEALEKKIEDSKLKWQVNAKNNTN